MLTLAGNMMPLSIDRSRFSQSVVMDLATCRAGWGGKKGTVRYRPNQAVLCLGLYLHAVHGHCCGGAVEAQTLPSTVTKLVPYD